MIPGLAPDFALSSSLEGAGTVALRLAFALALGVAVAWIYRRTRDPAGSASSFPATLVLLAVLIAMVTQVIGDNVARAFSLVGALSIVRFRTVVRDTQDTAFVIFAVAVGMAVGAGAPWVGMLGLVVVGIAAHAMNRNASAHGGPMSLTVRTGLGVDLDALLGALRDRHLASLRVLSVGTGRQGASLDIAYEVVFKPDGSPDELVKTLYGSDGVHAVELRRPLQET